MSRPAPPESPFHDESDEFELENEPDPAGDEYSPDDVELACRLAEWRSSHRPETEEQSWWLEQAVRLSFELERLQRSVQATATRDARRAALAWDADRRLAAEEAAAGLSRRPSLVAARLKNSRHGCEWLLSRWEALGRVTQAGREWSPAQRSLAFDLLGVPRELRDGEPWEACGQACAAGLVVRQMEDLLRRKAEALDALDAGERDAARAGTPAAETAPLARLRRAEAACDRRLRDALARVGRKPAKVEPAPPTPASEPRVEARPARPTSYQPVVASRPRPSAEDARFYEEYEREVLRRLFEAEGNGAEPNGIGTNPPEASPGPR